ncbi:hypothetical protein PG999_012198 [Apiospora kogelbergensis]|uniref:Uncharacterized protein n=1 Tax=Apiospora kogelbergensis TaxID=1337665 RepID=A0AAW0QRJ9_9PEZI
MPVRSTSDHGGLRHSDIVVVDESSVNTTDAVYDSNSCRGASPSETSHRSGGHHKSSKSSGKTKHKSDKKKSKKTDAEKKKQQEEELFGMGSQFD